MEGKDCKHHKFGFCKYKNECNKIHFSEECKNMANCKNVKSCEKRHPKICKKFTTGECIFLNDCAYKHQKKILESDYHNMVEKLKQMEKVTQALTRKVLSLEEDIVKIKAKDKWSGGCERLGTCNCEEKDIKVKNDIPEKNVGMKEKLSKKGKKFNLPAKETKGEVKQSEKGKSVFKCTVCDYTSEREATLGNTLIQPMKVMCVKNVKRSCQPLWNCQNTLHSTKRNLR